MRLLSFISIIQRQGQVPQEQQLLRDFFFFYKFLQTPAKKSQLSRQVESGSRIDRLQQLGT